MCAFFAAEMGMGPGHYLTQVRLKAAKLLLAHRPYPLELVCQPVRFFRARTIFAACSAAARALPPPRGAGVNRGACGTPADADALERGLFV